MIVSIESMMFHVTKNDRSPGSTHVNRDGYPKPPLQPKVFLYLWSLSHRSAADSACLSVQHDQHVMPTEVAI